MAPTWRRFAMGELLRVKHGYAFKGEYFADDGPYVLLTPGNFEASGGLKLKGEKEKYYVGEFPPAFLLQRGDLLVAMTDLTQSARILGSPGVVPESSRYLHNQRLGKVVELKEDLIDRRFLYHLLNHNHVREQIKASATGATVRHTAPERIYAVKVALPDLGAQRRIASILSAYDDLIENNTRRIAILEEMARRIYEEWFVRFRFPGFEAVRMVESELGLVPEGWAPTTLGELVEFQKGKKPPAVFSDWAPGRAPALLIDTLRGGNVEFADVGRLVPVVKSETIMVMDGSGSAQVFIGHQGVIGSTLGRYRVTADAPVGAFWLYLFFLTNEADISAKNVGAAIPHANKDYIRSMPVTAPPSEVAARFEGLVAPMFDLIRNLKAKNSTLRASRDLLLPKLISGELSVENIEIAREAP